MYFLWPGGLSKAKPYKTGSRTPFTTLPLIQSHFKWTLFLSVVLTGLSPFYMPGINWMKPSKSLRRPVDYIKPSVV